MTTDDLDCPVCLASGAAFFQRVDGKKYFHCPGCKATFLDPLQTPTRKEEAAHYAHHQNEIADPGYRHFLSKLADPLIARLPAGAKGLDYGCGPGPALAAMLEAAGHRVALYDPVFRDDSSVLEARYDFIVCTETVEHFHAPAAEFSRMNAMLKPGGLFAIMTCFQTDDEKFAAWHYRADPTHVVFYREETFHALADIYGWRIEIPRKDVVIATKNLPDDARS